MVSLGLKQKLLLLAILPLTLLLISLLASTYYIESKNLKVEMNTFSERLLADKQNLLKTEIEIAIKIIEYQLSLGENAKVNDALRNVTFGDDGYFFMYDTEGETIFHALQPENEGKNRIALTDPNGKKIIVGLIKQAKAGGGFYTYHYQKPNTDQLIEKISYVAMVPNTNWLIGTGTYMDDIERELTSYNTTARNHMKDKAINLLLIAIFWVVLTILGVLFAANTIVKPIQRMVMNLDDIAKGEGDLTKRLLVEGNDEISQLGNSFNLFVDKLQGIIKDVTDVTRDVKAAADNINEQTNLMKTQLGNHNNETELVVTAITEMSATASEVAQNTTQVAESTQSATGDVAKAQECVDLSLTEVSQLMSEIDTAASQINSLSEQSKKINSVLTVIGGIAEQTNLLALNAAIEAARAGEQGRGFAVVADEVRNLASRTQESTLEIGDMLSELHKLVSDAVSTMNSSQQSCNRSVESSQAISESLGAVTSSVIAINDMSTQIATAAMEQSTVTEEINRNVFAIQEIVNELTTSSENTSKVSDHLATEGETLGKLVSQFKV
ncbi:cache domain-containing protein [Colwellia sp. D2M02]|uniref:methyl-accepting chemotaxis protein n=1 Tax=Colwellia sp. D2M02 TaxID=2841562 RepID=UPI001C090AFC|nr:methyl-accepting chemotaxis protein [Colwellia sp. D2M02]MBU2895069.1 cache domain-containing protein [Colwellia sp. D2M02]